MCNLLFILTFNKYNTCIFIYTIMFKMNANKVANEENMKGWTDQPHNYIVTKEPC